MDQKAARNGLELMRSVSAKQLDLLRSSARYISAVKGIHPAWTKCILGQVSDAVGHEKGKYSLIRDVEDSQLGLYDKPLPCFGCGIGWFSFLLGFVFPLMWYYATILYFGNYYRRDPRERGGLAASAIALVSPRSQDASKQPHEFEKIEVQLQVYTPL
ncbi:hypothetical protein CJ030_MR6G016525 [Morella rubra]|uniref:Uncharacterized protein n=1 Tax=Morella rubra TaxID=262757 RepID=A0A6A1V933_9ROSI|nr:hypothetical protein CJ030_MR6G016525 [Morella rubra]